jgi:uncharacterized protein (TIGR02001 family)
MGSLFKALQRGGLPLLLAPVLLAVQGIMPAYAQSAGATTEGATAGVIGLGGRGWSADAIRPATTQGNAATPEFSARVGAVTDYIYRGTTLSDHRPAYGAAVEATLAQFYAAATVATVKLPTRPVAEYTLSGGVRPKIGDVDLDLGVTYFHYPGEALPGPTNGIDYWETMMRADTGIGESFRLAGGYAYSPNVSNTGAWSQYVAGGIGYDVPHHLLPQDLSVSITSAAGWSWFGKQSELLGGFALPAYLNWHAGMTFTYKHLNLDLRYYDTNLSKENCFVFTGDPNARPGGRADPITNPEGLTSRWCSATFVAKLWFALNGPR